MIARRAYPGLPASFFHPPRHDGKQEHLHRLSLQDRLRPGSADENKRLNEVLDSADFDPFCETGCAGFYHNKPGRPSLPPGQYFRVMVIGFFEWLESERGIAWRLADSPAPAVPVDRTR